MPMTSMDPGLLYWTGAWINMGVLVVCLLSGIRHIRRGAIGVHRKRMLTASGLVVLFLASYACKLIWIGREDLGLWAPSFVWVLRFHELCVLSMVVSGSIALTLAHRAGLATAPSPPGATAELQRHRHRRAGWAAAVSATLGVLSAAYVLLGMAQRWASGGSL